MGRARCLGARADGTRRTDVPVPTRRRAGTWVRFVAAAVMTVLVGLGSPGVAGAGGLPLAGAAGSPAGAAAGTATITGLVSHDGDPVGGMGVSLTTATDATVVVQRSTDASGRFTFDGLAAGSYRLLAWTPTGPYPATWYPGTMAWADATELAVADGGTTVADLAVDLPATIRGTVRYGSAPLPGAGVWAYAVPSGTWVRGTTSAADGSFTLGNLVAGSYRVHGFGDGNDRWYVAADDFATATDIAAPAGDATTIDLDLARTGTIEAHAYAGVNALAGVQVFLTGIDGVLRSTLTTDAAGDVRFPALEPGEYRVAFGDPTRTFPAGAWWLDGSDERLATPVTVTAGETAHVDQELFTAPDVPAPPFSGVPGGPRVVVVGDSITAQSSSEIGDAIGTSSAVAVRGINNMRIDELLPAAQRFAVAGPSQAVIALGTNDANQSWPLEESLAALDLLVGTFPTAACIDVLTVNDRTSWSTVNRNAGALNAAIRQLPAMDPRIRVVEWQQVRARYLLAGQPDGEWTTDLVHLNPRGQVVYGRLMADAVGACDDAPSSLSGRAFRDDDGDGLAGPTEPPLPGGTVTVTGIDVYGAAVTRTAAIGLDGTWRIDDLRSGRYDLVTVPVAGYAGATAVVGTLGGTAAAGSVTGITLGPGVDGTGYDLPTVPAVPAPVPPGAPTGVSAVAGHGAATVRWTAPVADGGSPVQSFHVRAEPGPAGCDAPAGVGAYTVTGLDDGVAHTFTVVAGNGAGPGPASDPSLAVVPRAVPDPPVGVTVVPADGGAFVTWQPPTTPGATVETYVATVTPGGATCTWTGGPLGCSVTGLVDGTAHRATVVAVGALGQGLPSAPSASFVPGRAPGAPSAVTATPGAGTASVAWTPPVDDSGAGVTTATVVADPGGASCTWHGGPTRCLVTGLADGVAHTFTVVAGNGIGTGPASAPSAPVSPAGVPTAPTAVAAASGDGSLTVSWDPPLDERGAAVDRVVVRARPGAHVCEWTGGPRTCTINGLVNGRPYTIDVTAANALGAGPPEVLDGSVSPATVPGAPTAVVAVAGRQQATVSWTAPVDDGGRPVTSYVVTADPGGASCAWTGGPLTCTLTGLAAGTPHTFTVVAANAMGDGPASVASAPVEPWSGVGFHAVTPFRVWDSRGGPGPVGAVGPDAAVVVPVAGRGSLPTGASAVVLNVTVTGASAASYLTAAPAGEPVPGTANLLFAAGQTVPNHVTVRLGADGAVAFANHAGTVEVIADVLGYYDDGTAPGDRFTALTPARLLDSRTAVGGWGATPIGPGQTRALTVRGAAGIPVGATAVVLDVTVTGGTSASFVQAFPSGRPRPITANLLFAAGQTVPNLVTAGIGDDGTISLYNQKGQVDVVVDVVGYYDPAGDALFHALTPVRVLDSRAVGPDPWDGVPVGRGESRRLALAGVPADATAVVGNLTATGATRPSYVAVSPAPGAVPAPTATVLFAAGQTVPNALAVGLGPGATVDVFNQLGTVHVVLDLAGYFVPS